MAPVILRLDVHCYGCAGRIRKAVKNLLGTYVSDPSRALGSGSGRPAVHKAAALGSSN